MIEWFLSAVFVVFASWADVPADEPRPVEWFPAPVVRGYLPDAPLPVYGTGPRGGPAAEPADPSDGAQRPEELIGRSILCPDGTTDGYVVDVHGNTDCP